MIVYYTLWTGEITDQDKHSDDFTWISDSVEYQSFNNKLLYQFSTALDSVSWWLFLHSVIIIQFVINTKLDGTRRAAIHASTVMPAVTLTFDL